MRTKEAKAQRQCAGVIAKAQQSDQQLVDKCTVGDSVANSVVVIQFCTVPHCEHCTATCLLREVSQNISCEPTGLRVGGPSGWSVLCRGKNHRKGVWNGRKK